MTASPAAPDWGIDYGIDALWHEVLPGLWIGGTDDHDTVSTRRPSRPSSYGVSWDLEDATITRKDFDAVVTCYAWAQPVDWEVEEMRYGFYDGGGEFDAETVEEMAEWAHRRWKSGKRVLVRCQAGLSRSALVTSLVLMREGYTARGAISLIREKRTQQCLAHNRTFVSYLLER